MSPEDKLKSLGLVLPDVPRPIANYVPFKVDGTTIYLAGQGPRGAKGELIGGKVGRVAGAVAFDPEQALSRHSRGDRANVGADPCVACGTCRKPVCLVVSHAKPSNAQLISGVDGGP